MRIQINKTIEGISFYPRYSLDNLFRWIEFFVLLFVFIIPIIVGKFWFIIFIDIPLIFIFYYILSFQKTILVLKEDSIKVFHTSNWITEYKYNKIIYIEYKTPLSSPENGLLEFSFDVDGKIIKAVLTVNSEEYVAEILNFLKEKVNAKVINLIDMELWGIYKVNNRFVVKTDRKRKKYKILSFSERNQEKKLKNNEEYYSRFSNDIINDSFYFLILAAVFTIPILFKDLLAIILLYIPLSFFLYKKLSLRRRITVLGQNSLKVFHISNWIKEYQYHQIYYIEYKTPLSAPAGGFLEFFIKDNDKNIKAIFYVSSQEYAAEILNFLSAKLDDKVVSAINMELWGIFREDNTFVVKSVQPRFFTDKKLVLGIQKKVKPRIVRRNTRYRRR